MQGFIEIIQAHPDLAEFIGVIGFMIYIGNFFSVQSGFLCGNGIAFPILQVIAATFVLISLTTAYNLPAFMIQISYIAIGLFGIALRYMKVRIRQSPLPQAMDPMNSGPDPDSPPDRHQAETLPSHARGMSDSLTSPPLCP